MGKMTSEVRIQRAVVTPKGDKYTISLLLLDRSGRRRWDQATLIRGGPKRPMIDRVLESMPHLSSSETED